MGSFEREMLEIDIEAIERELDPRPVFTAIPASKPKIKTVAESTRCKKTGKIQFDTASEAIEALRQWRMKDPNVCWDLKRMRVYKCKKCHKMHLGKV